MMLTACSAGVLVVMKGMAWLDVLERSRLWMLLAKTLARITEALLLVPRQELKTQLKSYQELMGALLAWRLPPLPACAFVGLVAGLPQSHCNLLRLQL